MNSRLILAIGGLLIALATIAGAFGTHSLREALAPDRLGIYDTAVRYQFYHAIGLLAVGLAAQTNESKTLRVAAGLIIAGLLLFSGTLYALSFGAPRLIGAITPVGGLALIAGWVLFAAGVYRGSH